MMKRLSILLFPALFFALSLQAQTPRSTISFTPPQMQGLESTFACPVGQQNFAGTVSLGTITAQSNDVDLDTMYLCFGDMVEILHNGDANLSGDPDPTTAPGIGYAFYNCPPIVMGPDLPNIATDPCLVMNPPPPGDFWVATEGNLNGDILFFNDGSLINFFNGGAPALYWWAPITFDSLVTTIIGTDTAYQALYEMNGPCVNANVNAAFAVVYLNAIDATNINNNAGASGCEGSFIVQGGLPEFDGGAYNITIVNDADPSITGTITSGVPNHGDVVTFTVPVSGLYNITIEDGKSCGAAFQMDMSACVNVTLEIANDQGIPGGTVCVPVTATDFTDIVSMQLAINFDPAILSFTGAQNFNANLTGLDAADFNAAGNLIISSWVSPGLTPVSVPNGAVLFELCFDIIGNLGDVSPVAFSPTGVNEITSATDLLGFNGIDGSVTVSSSALLTSYVVDSVSCPDISDGSFTVTVSNGASPYTITWQALPSGPVQGPGTINTEGGSFTATNLMAGDYSVTITDQTMPTMNVQVDTITIPAGPQMNVIFNQVQPACNGGLGDVTAILVLDSVAITNPGPQYAFSWGGGQTDATITDVPSGLYFVTITDNVTGCTTSGSTFLAQPSPLLILASNVSDATCSGLPDGSITVDVSGGTPDPFTAYNIEWPSLFQIDQATTSTAANLTDGDYQVIVTDGNGCQDSLTITVGAVKQLLLNANAVNSISCNGICDGSIEVQATTVGGVSNSYAFSWSGTPAPPPPVNTANTSALNGLCAGNYVVALTDDQGCMTTDTFELIEPPVLDIMAGDVVPESCTVGNDGSASVIVTGGTYPYFYNWGIFGQTDSTATGLSAGDYQVIVLDANGCQDSVSLTINMPVPPVITDFKNDTLPCFDSNDGQLIVFAQPGPGGAPISNYNWSNGQSGASLSSIMNLSPGTYVVTVTDESFCETIDSAMVIAPTPLVLDSMTTFSPPCPGDGNGGAVVFLSGGTEPYYYDWSVDAFDGLGSSGIGGATITAGDYSVTVTDANNCTPVVVNLTITDPPAIQATFDFNSIEPVSCYLSQGVPCDGQATVSAAYSDGSPGVFSFSWSSGEMDSGTDVSTAVQLCQDMQYVIISDGTCTVTDSVFIPFPPPLEPGPDTEVNRVSCFGLSDGSISMDVTGGMPPYSYSWSNGDMGAVIQNLPQGMYVATITDDNGCQFQFAATVEEPPPFVVFVDQTSSQDSVSCYGDSDATVVVGAQGGNLDISGDLFYNWGGGIAPPNSNTASNLSAGVYSVTVSDINGCSDDLLFTVYQPEPIQFELGPVEEIPCAGQQTTIVIDTAYGGNGLSSIWFTFSVDNTSEQPLGTPIPVFAGVHSITVYDGTGCTVDTSIVIGEPAPLILEYPESMVVELGDSVQIEYDAFQTSLPIDTVAWTPLTYLSFGADSLQPWVRPITSQQYNVYIQDVNGCPATASIYIEVDKNLNVYIPNIFTPNFDGYNDFFQVYTGKGVRAIRSMRIFDRWGALLYERTNLPAQPAEYEGWDGTYRGQKANSGVYVYLIEVEFEDGEVLLFRGDVTLVR